MHHQCALLVTITNFDAHQNCICDTDAALGNFQKWCGTKRAVQHPALGTAQHNGKSWPVVPLGVSPQAGELEAAAFALDGMKSSPREILPADWQ